MISSEQVIKSYRLTRLLDTSVERNGKINIIMPSCNPLKELRPSKGHFRIN